MYDYISIMTILHVYMYIFYRNSASSISRYEHCWPEEKKKQQPK